jgi:Mg-chelatase subunit ChlD
VTIRADDPLVRWRLVLGAAARAGLGSPPLDRDARDADAALAWLYDRDGDHERRDILGQSGPSSQAGHSRHTGNLGGGRGPSTLSVPDWINEVHRLFPTDTIERLERDALDRYGIHEVVTNAEALARVQPSVSLLQAVMRTKHRMNPEVLELAREIVRRVVADLQQKLRAAVERHFHGRLDPRRSTPHRHAQNLDAKRTIRKNLGRYSLAERRLYLERPWFVARTRPHHIRWQVIILVDQSASMCGSVICAAVMAACLYGLPTLKTHLCIFDTNVVDLTSEISDPVVTLMKVQLGGGTDITKAVAYAQDLVENPRRAVVVLITDLCEGGPIESLVARVHDLCEQGTRVIVLAALNEHAKPFFDRENAQRLADVGARVGAMTPDHLAQFLADVVRA